MRRFKDLDRFEVLCWVFTLAAILFLAGPVAGLLLSVDPDFFAHDARDPEIWRSLKITVFSGFASSMLGLVTGLPLAWVLSTSSVRVRNTIEPLIEIPILLPPVIAGICLVSFLSEKSIVGGIFSRLGIEFISSVWGIVAGMYFVGVPFIVKTSLSAFQEIDHRIIRTARLLGAGSARAFFTIVLPHSSRAILTGFILMLGRSIGIFGTVVMIAYEPKTVPVLVYHRFVSMGIEAAKTPAVLLIGLSLLFFAMRRLTVRGS
ncbi:MAG: ABC transporter permease [Candidatus Wallbacteria bacterium]|nr:ABC transporter permease [Candidatus Wallbacteria bacterium]